MLSRTFSNRLEKKMLHVGNVPSSQDPFLASANAEGPQLALIVLAFAASQRVL